MIRFTPYPIWTTEFLAHGAFDDLNVLFKLTNFTDWPSLDWLNDGFSAVNENAKQLEFTDNASLGDESLYYEEIIFEKGVIPTRLENWHDFFGATVWRLFPRTKALLNALHMQEIEIHGKQHRSRCRNALTLFDECGVVMAVSDDSWEPAFCDHRWEDVFIARRGEWGATIRPYLFGHANYEMLTRPFAGLTGKALFIKVNSEIFCKDLAAQYAYLDEVLWAMIREQGVLNDNKSMSPLPLLGVPGWYRGNEDPAYYNNKDYFREKRRKTTHD